MADPGQESILTDLLDQSMELFALPPRQVSLVAGQWTQIASAQPTRMTLTIVNGNFSDRIQVAPVPVGAGAVVSTLTDQLPIQLHASVWPLLIGGPWWAFSTPGQTVTIIEVIRQQ